MTAVRPEGDLRGQAYERGEARETSPRLNASVVRVARPPAVISIKSTKLDDAPKRLAGLQVGKTIVDLGQL